MVYPSKYDPKMCERVIELGKEGKCNRQIACDLGISRHTLYDFEKRFPDFAVALEKAKEYAHSYMISLAEKNIDNPSFSFNGWDKIMRAKSMGSKNRRVRIKDDEVDLNASLDVQRSQYAKLLHSGEIDHDEYKNMVNGLAVAEKIRETEEYIKKADKVIEAAAKLEQLQDTLDDEQED